MASTYAAGVLWAVVSGACQNVGLLLQKRAVNRLETTGGQSGFFSRLLRQPLWLLGLATNFGLGTVFFLLAQVRIGPALIPGLMASGLILLALGSRPIAGDRLARGEIVGVLLMAAGTALLGISRMSIDLRQYDVLSGGFLRRAALFTAGGGALMMASLIVERRDRLHRGIVLALLSGFLYVLSNFWVGPFVSVSLSILAGTGTMSHYLMFVLGAVVLVLTNLFGMATLQSSFRHCKAAQAIPIQNVPVQLAPAIVYLGVFRLASPTRYSVPALMLGVALILGSSFLLAARQARLGAEARDARRAA